MSVVLQQAGDRLRAMEMQIGANQWAHVAWEGLHLNFTLTTTYFVMLRAVVFGGITAPNVETLGV